MGAEEIAGTMPVGAGAPDEALIDSAHLARQTFGDPLLESEVLGLFAEQLRSLAARLDGSSLQECRTLLHSIKGSARAIGAFPLADCAAALEGSPGDPVGRERLGLLIGRTLRRIGERSA